MMRPRLSDAPEPSALNNLLLTSGDQSVRTAAIFLPCGDRFRLLSSILGKEGRVRWNWGIGVVHRTTVYITAKLWAL